MDKLNSPEEAARVRTLADRLDFITEDDFRLLANATPATVLSWRLTGKGPAYVRLGRRYFYPAEAVKKFMDSAIRERNAGFKGASLL